MLETTVGGQVGVGVFEPGRIMGGPTRGRCQSDTAEGRCGRSPARLTGPYRVLRVVVLWVWGDWVWTPCYRQTVRIEVAQR